MKINSKQRAHLKKLSHSLDPIFQIGKNGITPEVTQGVSEALSARELVKINVLKNCFDEPKDIGVVISERTQSVLVQVIGRKIVLYKPSKEDPKIELPN